MGDDQDRFPIVAIHAAQLPTGKIMFFSYPTYPNRPNNAEAYLGIRPTRRRRRS